MKLNVPFYKQDKDSFDCGPTCLSMLMKYYGVDKNVDQIKEEIFVYPGMGTYVPQLGKYLIDKGFEVEIVTMNPHLFTKKLAKKSDEDLIKHIENLQEKNKKESFIEPLRFFKEFIQSGGKVTLRIPSIQDIEEEISNKRPICALLTSNFLLSDKVGFNFHFNVITGVDEEYVYVNDPLDDYRGGEQKYRINDFLYAIYASAYGDLDNASIMKVKLNQPKNL